MCLTLIISGLGFFGGSEAGGGQSDLERKGMCFVLFFVLLHSSLLPLLPVFFICHCNRWKCLLDSVKPSIYVFPFKSFPHICIHSHYSLGSLSPFIISFCLYVVSCTISSFGNTFQLHLGSFSGHCLYSPPCHPPPPIPLHSIATVFHFSLYWGCVCPSTSRLNSSIRK